MNITLSSSDICVRSGSIIAAEPKYFIFVMVLGHLTQHVECIVFCNVLVFYYSVLSFSSLLFSDVICISCFCVAVSLLFLVSPVCTFMFSTARHVPLSLSLHVLLSFAFFDSSPSTVFRVPFFLSLPHCLPSLSSFHECSFLPAPRSSCVISHSS